MLKNNDGAANRVHIHIFQVLLCSGIFAVATNIILAIWMSNSINSLSSQKSKLLIKSTLAAEVERVVITTWDYAQWDEAYEWVKARDNEAIFSSIGTGATEDETFDLLYLLKTDGTPMYAYKTGGESSDLTIYNQDIATLLVDAIKNTPLEPYKPVASFVALESQVAILAAGRIQPNNIDGIDPEDLNIMIGGIILSQERLQALSDRLLMDGMKISPTNNQAKAIENIVPIKNISGDDIAYISWLQESPGSKILQLTLPVIAILSLVLIFASLIIMWISSRQTKAFLHAQNTARRDKLTGLLNRRGFDELIDCSAMQSALAEGRLALLYLDLNGFKLLNDTEGHHAGDIALQTTAERLASSIRRADDIARIGGDEFVCIVIDNEPAQAADFVANRIIEKTESPITIKGTQHTIRVSIGIATSKPGVGWNTLISRADMAMYYAKSQQQLEPVYFTQSLTEIARKM